MEVVGVGFAAVDVDVRVDWVVGVGVEVGVVVGGVGVLPAAAFVVVVVDVCGAAFTGRGCDIGVSYRIWCLVNTGLCLLFPLSQNLPFDFLAYQKVKTYRSHEQSKHCTETTTHYTCHDRFACTRFHAHLHLNANQSVKPLLNDRYRTPPQ
jgi:uncharacterized paraquat-inducible protein A